MTQDHVHSFIRYKRTKKTIYFKCNDPHCTTIFDRELLIGKASLCPQCHVNEFILDREALRRATPKCVNCRNTKEAKMHKRAVELVSKILPPETDGEIFRTED